eukprot:TRINITY_DN4336_c0_g1_i1.p1 TRINITY_DN4336_c0_g1~~TRINITY_DN4336_c0_g1_i1.p1  ORF type:complete len:226 (+),score=51.54 TRINITY_DN4336_c0_g1_i1:23-679(+)
MSEAMTCSKCRQVGQVRRCPCLLAAYCSGECQREDWKVHHEVCSAVRRIRDEESCGSSGGLTDTESRERESPVKKDKRDMLSTQQVVMLNECVERLATTSPSLVAAVFIDLVQSDPVNLLPIAMRALAYSPVQPLPASSYIPSRPVQAKLMGNAPMPSSYLPGVEGVPLAAYSQPMQGQKNFFATSLVPAPVPLQQQQFQPDLEPNSLASAMASSVLE